MMDNFPFKKKVLPTAMAAAMASGMAFSGNAHAIQVAGDGIGQTLLAPIYQAYDGQSTLITVVNTNTTHAVKVKAVFRSKKYCKEVLDFLLYLSPGDVWRGEVYNKDGQAWIRSTDDSIRNLPFNDSFASIEDKNVDLKLFDHRLESGDDNEMGIIEFIGHYSATNTIFPGVGAPVEIKQGMSKFDLARIFDMSVQQIMAKNSIRCPNFGTKPGISNETCPVRVNKPSGLELRGNIEMVYSSGRMVYPMTALASTQRYTDNGVEGTYVIANPFLEIDTSTETALGIGWGHSFGNVVSSSVSLGFVGSYDNILEIEQALGTSIATGSYENGFAYEGGQGQTRYTGVQVSFPTKYRHRGPVCGTNALVNTLQGQFYPPFTVNGDMQYYMSSADNQENTVTTVVVGSSISGAEIQQDTTVRVITDCANMLIGTSLPLFNYDSGIYHLNLIATRGTTGSCPYSGVPAVTQTYKYTADPSGNSQNHVLIPASANAWKWQ